MLFRITGDVRGMRVLDIGCGTGVWSSILALLGASVIGADVSEAELKIATERAAANGITSRLALTLASVHSLPFESGSFDLVFGNAILHHVDLSRAGAETARVLRSGGRAVFREPVALSATLRRLRKSIIVARLVKDSRISPDEEPLTRGQIEEFGDLFSDHRVHEMQMLARFDRIFRTPRVIKMLNEVDLRLFDFFPPLRRFARQAIVEFVK
jgi:SAM-dependent methyltransferase